MPFTYVIADVHGRFDLFDRAMDWILARPAGTIVCLGDYVDRGPQSKEVLDRLLQDVPAGWKLVRLKGNHEDFMYGALRERDAGCEETWLANGGQETLASYSENRVVHENNALDKLSLDLHLDLIKRLKLYHEDKHRVYVHAKVNTNLALEDHPEALLLWARYAPNEIGGYGTKHVVHGHTPNFSPELKLGRTNLDCSAVYTGRLAIGIFDDDLPGGPIDIKYIRV